MNWCILAILLGLLVFFSGVPASLKFQLPRLGIVSGSGGVVLMALGILLGVGGFC